MRRTKNSQKIVSVGLGIAFVPLGFATGLTNDMPWVGLFIGIIFAGMIEFIRYKRLKNT